MSESSEQCELPKAWIFGAGIAGQSALKNLSNEYAIQGFLDNDCAKQGTLIERLPVVSPKDATSLDGFILIASEFYEQIREQLIQDSAIAPERIKTIPARSTKRLTLDTVAPQAIDLLHVVCQWLDQRNLYFHIDAGTLLGLFRDGQLIPWDDDLDVAINPTTSEALINAKASLLHRLTKETGANWDLTSWYTEQGFGNVPAGAIRAHKLNCVDSEEFPALDFFVKYSDGEFSDYCLASRGIRMPAAYTQSTRAYAAANRDWQIPVRPEEYLAEHYGHDWQTPNPSWSLQDLSNAQVFGANLRGK